MYMPLQIPTLFVPAHNAFMCEDDSTELVEHIPDETDSSDKMQRFNRATQPIRDALRAVEGITLPTVNILAWVAEHTKSALVLAEGDEAGNAAKVQVVLGGEGEREQVERERLAEQQR
jgi:transcription initiation factor TFIIE subunit alpha